jgi:hypothetical protein
MVGTGLAGEPITVEINSGRREFSDGRFMGGKQ